MSSPTSSERAAAPRGQVPASTSVPRLVDRGPDRRRAHLPIDRIDSAHVSGNTGRRSVVPPGWPAAVLPMGVPGWEESADAWLLDQCPADYRAHPVWRRHPIVLAWVAGLHVAAQLDAMREAFRKVRVEMADELEPAAVTAARAALEAEGLRLRAVQRGIELVAAALRGEVYVPKL